jgi:hypothetical protein
MKSDRRTKEQIVSDALAKEMDGLPGMLKRWGNTALTVILVIAAVAMLVRWRLATAEQARLSLVNSLSNARSYVMQLLPENMLGQPAQILAPNRTNLASLASAEISSVLNNTDDPKFKAPALITRGDLYWQLANFPELPGAATQPSLRSLESREELLTKSADAYNEVFKNDAYKDQKDSLTSAHFGLAAIAQNRRDWDTARHELELIANNSDVLPVLVQQAKDQLKALDEMRAPLYLTPATQATTEPTTKPATTHPASTAP